MVNGFILYIRDKAHLIKWLAVVALVITVAVLTIRLHNASRAIAEAQQDTRNAYALLDTLRHKAFCDSLNYAEQNVYITNDAEALREQLSKQTIALAKASVTARQVISQASETTAEARYEIRYDTIKMRITEPFRYSDQWITVNIDSILHIATRDSLSMIITRQYRHRFLWWRWGNAGYRVTIANFNPHSTITYNRTVMLSDK